MSALPQQATSSARASLWAAYQRLIAERTGLQLSKQQLGELEMLVTTLLATAGEALTPEDLHAAFLRGARADLFAALAARLTIGETHFFRVAPQIAALREVVLPDLLARRASRRRLNCWSAGCSSGEEAYTLAIVLRELLTVAAPWQLHILATDLSAPALDAARRACYREWSFRETPEQIRRRYFERDGESWCLSDAIRRMVRFAPHNLIADPPPAPTPEVAAFDLILCRNVTIYFNSPVTQRLYRRFADALVPGGWLILGPSDPPPLGDRFEAVYLPDAVLWRKATPPRIVAPVRRAQGIEPSDARSSSGDLRPAPAIPAARSDTPRSTPPAAVPTDMGESCLAEMHALVREGAREAARERLGQLARSAPLAVATHRLLGILALEDGLHAVALESLRRATFLAADDPLAQFGLGRAYRALGDEMRAVAAFRHARRVLAPWPGDRPIPGDEGLTAEELRGVIEVQLAASGESRKG